MTDPTDTGAGPPPATARHEAERLVAAGLAALSVAADRIGAPERQRGGPAAAGYDALGDLLFGRSHQRHAVANDSAACCRCPVCRVISAAREPDPVFAERLATGAGTLAEGAARVLRTVASAAAAEQGTGRDQPADSAAPAGSAGPAAPAGSPGPAAPAESSGPPR